MKNTNKQMVIPISIVIAGLLIASAVYFTRTTPKTDPSQEAEQVQAEKVPSQQQAQQSTLDAIRPVNEDDHIRGKLDAKVTIVEYSDFECPFCQRFHNTMNKVMEKYGENGEVAWVYRQFPLEQLHPVKSQAVAVASECANELGGNNAFWQFANTYFERTLTNNRTDIETVIPQIVSEIGLNLNAFQSCLESGKYDEHIQADLANGVKTGGRGTPWSVLISSDGTKYPINGAQPYEVIEQMIEQALK